MFQNFLPNYYFNSVDAIPKDILKRDGIRAVICDLDNTLDSHRDKAPSERALAFLKSLKDLGVLVCIISNGKHERVTKYLENLDIPFLASAGKPLKKSYLRALTLLDCKPEEALFIGDQIFTDIWGANRVGLKTILVDPIESYENSFFYIKRALEIFVKAKITKE